MQFWIPDPMCDQEPVAFWRWLAWHVAERLDAWARSLNFLAVNGRWYRDDDLPF